jgi:SAM-dependent methyltransferase
VIKATVQNLFARMFGPDLVGRLWWRIRGRPAEHLRGDRRRRFEYAYASRYWVGGRDDGPPSGWGSSLEATGLPRLLKELRATSLLDIGCGDFTWMQELELPCRYIGADIVPALIAEHRQRFAGPSREFIVLDACEEPLPAADIVLCREVLFHLCFADMCKLVDHVRASGARYLLATTNPNVAVNVDIPTGEHSDRNLAIAPLKLGKPERALADDAVAAGRVLGVWRLR